MALEYRLVNLKQPYTPSEGDTFSVTTHAEVQRIFDDLARGGWEYAGRIPSPAGNELLAFRRSVPE